MSQGDFRISSFCGGGTCVEVAWSEEAGLVVRSTVAPAAGSVIVPLAGRLSLVSAVKSGRLDSPETPA